MASNSKLTAIVAALLPRPIYNQPHDQNAGATPRVKAAMGRSVGCVVRRCPAPGRLRGHSWPRRRRGPTQGHDDHAGHRLAQRQPEVGGRLRVRRRLRVERRAQWRSGAGPTICHGGRQPNPDAGLLTLHANPRGAELPRTQLAGSSAGKRHQPQLAQFPIRQQGLSALVAERRPAHPRPAGPSPRPGPQVLPVHAFSRHFRFPRPPVCWRRSHQYQPPRRSW
jgi:hypothetical protein